MYRRIVCPWQIMGIIDPTFLRVIDKHFFFLRFLDNHSYEIKIRETRIPEPSTIDFFLRQIPMAPNMDTSASNFIRFMSSTMQ